MMDYCVCPELFAVTCSDESAVLYERLIT